MVQVAVLRQARCAIAIVLCGLAGAGCLFEPRAAEPPQTGVVVPYLDQINPANTWENLQTSALYSHAPGWEGAISSTNFRYIPDSAAEAQFPGVFTDWGRDREVAFINAFYNTGVTLEPVRMRNAGFVVPPSSGSESIWENVIYELTVTSAPPESRSVKYRGSAIITFSLEGNFWYITEWRDLQGESDPDTDPPQLLSTLGVLRGNFASK